MKRKIRLALIVFGTLIIAIALIIMYQLLNTSRTNPDGVIMEDEEVQENIVVMEREDGGTISEGNSIPRDINLNGIIPKLPPTSKRLSVIDNNQEGLRRIILKYQISRENTELRKLIVDDLNLKNWDTIEERTNGIIFAERGNTNVSIEVYEVDKLKQLVTIVVIMTD